MRPISSLRSVKKFSITAFLIAVGAGLAFSVKAWRVPVAPYASRANEARSTQSSAPTIEAPQAEHLEAQVVTLRPSGFEPAQISRRQGQFLLAVNNQTGLEDLTLRLEREDGAREQEVRFPGHRPRWRARLNLPAGNYFLRVVGHADWMCRIAIR